MILLLFDICSSMPSNYGRDASNNALTYEAFSKLIIASRRARWQAIVIKFIYYEVWLIKIEFRFWRMIARLNMKQ